MSVCHQQASHTNCAISTQQLTTSACASAVNCCAESGSVPSNQQVSMFKVPALNTFFCPLDSPPPPPPTHTHTYTPKAREAKSLHKQVVIGFYYASLTQPEQWQNRLTRYGEFTYCDKVFVVHKTGILA